MHMNRSAFLGPVLILLGAFMLIQGNIDLDSGTIFQYFWPSMFVLPTGVLFHWLYFSVLDRRGVGLLVPGGLLLTSGIVCQIAMLFDLWSIMWPGFLLATAVGLFELYVFGGHNKWLLIPIHILTMLSVLFFAVFSIGHLFHAFTFIQPLLAVALMMAGMLLAFGKRSTTD